MLIDCLHNIVGGGFKRIIWKMTKKIIDLMWRHAAKLLRRTRDAGTTLWSQICLGEWDDIGFLNVMVGLEYGYESISNKSSSICEVEVYKRFGISNRRQLRVQRLQCCPFRPLCGSIRSAASLTAIQKSVEIYIYKFNFAFLFAVSRIVRLSIFHMPARIVLASAHESYGDECVRGNA